MRDAFSLIWLVLIGLFRSRASLQVEILTLRCDINRRATSLQQHRPSRICLVVSVGTWRAGRFEDRQAGDRDPLASCRLPSALALEIKTWRPKTPLEIRHLIRKMCLANPLWGAPRIHGELLKLGIDVGQTTVAKYMARGRRPPSQGWKTFLHNHADGIASMDLFVVPTISFRLLYGLLILHHDRRQMLWLFSRPYPATLKP